MDGELARLPSDDEFAVESAEFDSEVAKLTELHTDIERLHLRDGDPVDPAVHVTNRLWGFYDELQRLIAALVIVDVALVALTVASPWFWIGAGAALGYTITLFVWLARRRVAVRRAAQKSLDR